MQALEFLREPDSGGVRPVYAVSGEDAYLRREVLDAIARVALGGAADELALGRFPGDQAQLADVFDELRTLPFLTRRRIAIVEDADPFVTAHRKELEHYAERPAATGVLILAVKSWPSNTRLAKLIDQVGLAIDCKSPREQDLPRWLVGLARSRFACKLDDDAARLMVELVGPEVALLAGELEKTAVYVGERRTIHRADVSRMVGAGRIETIWQILDAATTGQAAEALDHLDRLLASGESPIYLLNAMSASLRKVHHAGQLRKARVEARAACQQAGIPSFAIDKTLKQHAHLGPSRVERLPALLLQADLDLKGSSMLPPRTVMERLLVELARPRQD
jgi:DNA polymerase-3 subunit delta